MTDLRKAVLFLTIGSFSVAALLGVLALLSGGEFGEDETNVLLTTLLVGVTSVLVLCYLSTAGTAYSVVGLLGALAALPTLGIGLLLVWTGLGDSHEALSWKPFAIGCVVSPTLAQAALLLVLSAGAASYVRGLLAGTLAAASWVAVHVSAIIIDLDPSGGSLRLLGVVAILDVLGTVAVAALARFGRPARPAAPRLVVPSDVATLVERRAAAAGQRPDEFLRALLHLHSPAEGAVGSGRR